MTSPPPFEPVDNRFAAGPPVLLAAQEAHRFGRAGEPIPVGPQRPTYREPHPVRGWFFTAGLAGAAAWMLLLPLLASDLRGYAWWTLIAGALAWLAAAVLTRLGDRGVAAGISVSVSVAVAIGTFAVAARWMETADWPLW